jgi:Intein splicing domain
MPPTTTPRGPRGYRVALTTAERDPALAAGLDLARTTARRLGLWSRVKAGTATDAQRRGIVGRISLDARHQTRVLAEKFLTGEVSRGAWHDRMRALVLPRLYAGIAAGLGGPLTDADRVWADAEVRRHVGYLKRFATKIGTGDQAFDGTVRTRADQYGAAVWAAAQGAILHRAITDGHTQALRVLGVADHCFIAGTSVETDQGSLPIELIRVGDRVLTRSGFRRVIRIFHHKYQGRLTEIRSPGRSVICTPNHPFLTFNGWCVADNLISGQHVMVLNDVFNNRKSNILTPDSDDLIPESRKIFIPFNIPCLLFELMISQRLMLRMSMPVFSIDLDDQFSYPEINRKINLYFSLIFKGNIQRFQNFLHFQFRFGWAEFSEFGKHLHRSLVTLRGTSGIVGPHVLSGLLMDDAPPRVRAQFDLETIGFVSDDKSSNAKSLSNPFCSIYWIVIYQETNHLFGPEDFFFRIFKAPDASLGKVIFRTTAFRANRTGIRPNPSTLFTFRDFSVSTFPTSWTGQLCGGSLTFSRTAAKTNRVVSFPEVTAFRAVKPCVVMDEFTVSHRDSVYQISVYNVEVENDHEYFANGFLVHNCTSHGDLMGCVEQAALGWQLIEDVRLIGESPCRSRCRCHIETRK